MLTDTKYPIERSFGYRMAELEPIKGYNRTKTAIPPERLLRKDVLLKPTPPRPFNVFEQTLHWQLGNHEWELKIGPLVPS